MILPFLHCFYYRGMAIFVHHFIAGIRFLLLDVHIGVDLKPARSSSLVVLVLSVLITIAAAVRAWM